jgi:hypothetical protein
LGILGFLIFIAGIWTAYTFAVLAFKDQVHRDNVNNFKHEIPDAKLIEIFPVTDYDRRTKIQMLRWNCTKTGHSPDWFPENFICTSFAIPKENPKIGTLRTMYVNSNSDNFRCGFDYEGSSIYFGEGIGMFIFGVFLIILTIASIVGMFSCEGSD